MIVASIIIGILLIIGGIICIASPASTYLGLMMFIAILLLVYGISGIIRFFKRLAFVPEFIVSILATVIGFIYLFRPGSTPAAGTLIGIDRVVLFLVGAWFLVKGCIIVYYSVKTRFVNNYWILGFISGVLSVILGIYSLIYPSAAITAVGTLVGFWYIQSGCDFVAFGIAAKVFKDSAIEFRDSVNQAINEVEKSIQKEVDNFQKEVEKLEAEDADKSEPKEVKVVDKTEDKPKKTGE